MAELPISNEEYEEIMDIFRKDAETRALASNDSKNGKLRSTTLSPAPTSRSSTLSPVPSSSNDFGSRNSNISSNPRGHPRKTPAPSTSNDSGSRNSNISSNPRGRPRKTPAPSTSNDSGSQNCSKDSKSQARVVSKRTGRPRGRPRLSDNPPPKSTQNAKDKNANGKGAKKAHAATQTADDGTPMGIPNAWICCECYNVNVEKRLPCSLCYKEYCAWCIPAVL